VNKNVILPFSGSKLLELRAKATVVELKIFGCKKARSYWIRPKKE
jgi:hypothetical protein